MGDTQIYLALVKCIFQLVQIDHTERGVAVRTRGASPRIALALRFIYTQYTNHHAVLKKQRAGASTLVVFLLCPAHNKQSWLTIS